MSSNLNIDSYLGYLSGVRNLAIDPTATTEGSGGELFDLQIQAILNGQYSLDNTTDLNSFVSTYGTNILDILSGTSFSIAIPSTLVETWNDRDHVFSELSFPDAADTINEGLTFIEAHPSPTYTSLVTQLSGPPLPVVNDIDVRDILINDLSTLQATFSSLLSKLTQQNIDGYNSLTDSQKSFWWRNGSIDVLPQELNTDAERHALYYTWNFYRMFLSGTTSSGWQYINDTPSIS
jgi:hypothetical protein